VVERRSYDDPCGVARALALIGERWALLIVRELLLGPKRFTDLRVGLPTASQNVLSHRLRELEQGGLVSRRKLGPPAGSWVYELTERGYDLEPVLFQLARWGSRAPITSDGELSVDALILALRTTFDPQAAGSLQATIELRLSGDRVHAALADGRIDWARGGAADADAVIECDAATLRAVVFGGRSFAAAARDGQLSVEGSRKIASRFVTLFPRPEPATHAAARNRGTRSSRETTGSGHPRRAGRAKT
jgi:DNA-binding HxlR family transcriptional regulator